MLVLALEFKIHIQKTYLRIETRLNPFSKVILLAVQKSVSINFSELFALYTCETSNVRKGPVYSAVFLLSQLILRIPC